MSGLPMEYKIKNNNKALFTRKQLGLLAMKTHNHIELQAIMNLLYIGEHEDPSALHHTHPKREFGTINDSHNKVKSSTVHLRNTKNNFANTNAKTQSREPSPLYRKHSSENKENLKKILQKLENTPSPPPKKKEPCKLRQMKRIETQNSQPQSRSMSKNSQNKSVKFSKQSLDKLFDKRKDKDFIRSLIKAKIVQKLRRIETKKSDKKACNLGGKIQTLVGFNTKMHNQARPTVLPSSKSRQLKSNFMDLLREEKKLNNPVLSRKNSKLTVKKLLL